MTDIRRYRLAKMREVKAEMSFQMLAYAVLNDHFHGIVRPDTGNDFSRIMQSVKLRYTHRHKQHTVRHKR